MKHTHLFICCCLLFLAACSSSTKKTEETKDTVETSTATFPEDTQGISEVITHFANAYLSQDNEKANTYIHPDLGLYVIYRPGVSDIYERVDSLDFSKPIPAYFPYTSFKSEYTLTFGALPAYDCGLQKWDKLGFYCDTTSQADQLTAIATFQREFNDVSNSELEEIKRLEKDTFRVILAKDEHLIFHVKKHQDNWYIFLLDRAYAGCDA